MKLFRFLVLACAPVVLAGVAHAGADYSIDIGEGSAETGMTADVAVTMDSSAGLDVQGWSWGVCTADTSIATINSVVDGATTATIADGDPPDFDQINVIVGQGWTVGVVISFLGLFVLPPGAGYEMNIATYDVLAEGTTDLNFCSTLGDPPVATVIVVGGQSIPPAVAPGSITGLEGPPPPMPFLYRAQDATSNNLAGATFSTNAAITDQLAPFDDNTQGFSMGLGHDSTVLNVTGIAPTGELGALDGGDGPEFFGLALLANGWTVGVVYRFLGGVFIQFDVEKDVVSADYSVVADQPDGSTTSLDWTSTLGDPPVANVVVVMGQSIQTDTDSGIVTFIGVPPIHDFIRGDCNQDGTVNIADAVFIIQNLFVDMQTTDCVSACDANDDGAILDMGAMMDISDATYILNYRFLDGPPPPSPFPDCGSDEDDDCDDHDACP